jgi:hypothetical protein
VNVETLSMTRAAAAVAASEDLMAGQMSLVEHCADLDASLGAWLHVTRHTSHLTHNCSEEKATWEVKRYRLEGATLIEFSTFNFDEIAREISLEGVVLFKNVGPKVGFYAAA